MYYLKGDVVTDGRILKNSFVEIKDGKISYINQEMKKNDVPVYEINDGYICPGFTDIHIHGIDGMDFMDEEPAIFRSISNGLLKYGVTSYLATSRTAALQDIQRFLEAADKHKHELINGAKMLGVHIEGPWISTKYKGAQSEELIRKLTKEDMKNVIKPFTDIIKKITLAPEELTDISVIRKLKEMGVNSSAGHTNATIDEIEQAMEYGLKQLTHTFNAMSPLHHRTPGATAAALLFDDLICELITDGVHVHPKVIELLYKVKGKKGLALISDCTGYNKLPNGEYSLRGKDLIGNGNKVTLKNGTLAGSAITLDKGIKFVVENCNIPLEDAIFMATQTPLSTIDGMSNSGRVAVGHAADLIILNKKLEVSETIINGKTVFKKEME
ncbi:N-acetylglucosamine-6-phosphate deacetylase [Virgibacillus profundi]|uniref:N-acetylglucosamine-6-phosphate deacetylase n=1 Tax=Virgibacillus profundi TaxID=2024555 RepID=A0A2A2II78_9BACI|nr:N-acetylglucosamine-6-phosphate deacetylase [Virgibacillus profundi]PAV31242.1 N-acetylglucosamine-6-phosphate deacetylase [Virgibacillus profundi]PXY55427.1 N-acetylglucosamine-6-phosphate deacetylase [Virgibacillus profundi]